jgi:hypothetical protein
LLNESLIAQRVLQEVLYDMIPLVSYQRWPACFITNFDACMPSKPMGQKLN